MDTHVTVEVNLPVRFGSLSVSIFQVSKGKHFAGDNSSRMSCACFLIPEKNTKKIKSALQARFKFPLVLKPIKCVDNFII